MILPQAFYKKKTLKVAQELLGCFLIRQIGRQTLVAQIIETEAYVGFKDLASHAHVGKTPRTAVMFGQAGRAYVYLIYGRYYCLNIVTEDKDFPAAVLIRAAKPIIGLSTMKKLRSTVDEKNLLSGPGKLCQGLKIDKTFNDQLVTKRSQLFIADQFVYRNHKFLKPKKVKIIKGKRIGVDYAGAWADKLWRFTPLDNF